MTFVTVGLFGLAVVFAFLVVRTLPHGSVPLRAAWPDLCLVWLFALGTVASLVLGATTLRASGQPAPLNVVCESGTFEPVEDAADPYVREVADCTLGDVNGPAVRVVVID
jgi:hypothetical protein